MKNKVFVGLLGLAVLGSAGCVSVVEPGSEPVVLEPLLLLPADLQAVTNAVPASLSGLAAGSKAAQEEQLRVSAVTRLPLEVRTSKSGICLRLVPPGSFTMGSSWLESGHDPDESKHRVTIRHPFYMGRDEVTVAEWTRVMSASPARYGTPAQNTPVENVSWFEVQEFCKRLCELEGVRVGTYRLPTESEWEYACRAGTTTRFHVGDELTRAQACFGKAAYLDRPGPMPVGSFPANAWGLRDMHGNVWEWCLDWYAEDYSGTGVDDRGPAEGSLKACRGGGWGIDANYCRSANRNNEAAPDARCAWIGFRVVRVIVEQGGR